MKLPYTGWHAFKVNQSTNQPNIYLTSTETKSGENGKAYGVWTDRRGDKHLVYNKKILRSALVRQLV